MLRRFPLIAAGLAAGALTLAAPWHDARACGGGAFYTTEDQKISGAVGGHKVVLSLSTAQTVLWDQIAYKGAPKDFAWVMPVPDASTIDAASDAWIEALEGTTAPDISSPNLDCPSDSSSGCACGGVAGDALGGGNGFDGQRSTVTIVHQGSVGPYDMVTIKSGTPGAIGKWLTDNGYKIPAAVAPILDDYTAKGMSFIALRLKPDASIQQMTPVRVTMPGGLTTFPMRMLSAGAEGSVALEVFVISEGRVAVQGSPSAEIDAKNLVWDFANHTSNYADVRAKALAAAGKNAWLTVYAKQGPLLSPVDGEPYTVKDQSAPTIAAAYFLQAGADGEITGTCNLDSALAGSASKVVAGSPGSGEIAASTFECDTLADLGVALTGLHPKDVWLSRFEAELPVAALDVDLTFAPLMNGAPVENRLTAGGGASIPASCTLAAAAPPPGEASAPRPPSGRGRAALALGLTALALAFARRLGRASSALAPARSS